MATVASGISRTIVVLALTGAVAAAQQGATSVAILSGFVVTDNDVPLRRVRVVATDSSSPATFTDDRGQFVLRVSGTGSVRLLFTKARYAAVRLEVPGQAGGLRDVVGLRVRLSLGAAISGRVRDRSGEPVLQAQVTARRPGVASASVPTALVATTDDLGEFRFSGLEPGAYVVGVSRVQAGAERNIPAAFEQQTINVSGGADVVLDLPIDMPSELARYPQGYRTPSGPDATASVRGRVTTAQGVPIAGALVQVRGPGGLTQVESDGRGQYVLNRLAPGEYVIEAIKRGFSPVTPGMGQNAVEMLLRGDPPQDRTIVLLAGATLSAIDLMLGRGASVVGTIVDEFGEPMQGVTVNALELRVMGGVTRAMPVSSLQGGRAQTDDRGRYRLFGLQPGTYVIRAMADAPVSAVSGYVPIFYPGTPAIDSAMQTKLDADASVTGIDLTFVSGPVGRIRGTVVDPAGRAVRASIALTARGAPGGIQSEPLKAGGNPDGTFAFENVAPGEYVVHAIVTGLAVPEARVAYSSRYAAAGVTIGDVEPPPMSLKLSEGATLMGRVTYEGIEVLPPRYTGVELTAVSTDSDSRLLIDARVGFALLSDNTFEYRGVFGRKYLVGRVPNVDWYLKSITYRGQDLTDSAFDFGSSGTFRDIEVVVSGGGAAVSGRVSDERAAPVRDYTVAAFPTDRSKWTFLSRWLKAGPSSPDGTFHLTGLVPGEYWVVAVDRLEGNDVAGDLQSPDILDALSSRAVRVTLGERQSQDLPLRLIRR